MPNSRFYLRTLGKTRTKRVTSPRLRTHRLVKIGGVKKSLPVAHFWKDVISVGTYRHPITGERFKVTQERIDGWIKKYNAMRHKGIEIPTPVDHSDRAEDNRGFVVQARRNGDKLQLLHEVIGKDGVKLAARNRASVFIEHNYVDEHGKEWGEAITHSAFTPKPVINGLGEFIPFAASRASKGKQKKVPVFYLSRSKGAIMAGKTKTKTALSPKQLSKARKILGIEDDERVSDSEILRRLVSQQKLRKAGKAGLRDDGDEDEDELDEDDDTDAVDELDEEDDEDPEDEDEEGDDADIDDSADEEADDEDEDEDEEDEDEEGDNGKKKDKKKPAGSRKGGRVNRKHAAAVRRRQDRVRELSSTVSLSRVPKDTDAAVLTMVKRSLKTERRRCIERGAITPDVDAELANLLFTKGKPNGLALSRMPGSDEPLAFRLYEILRRNKPVPKTAKLGNQQAIALGRRVPGNDNKLDKELRDLRKEVRRHYRGTASAKTE